MRTLYPEIQPYKVHHLAVDATHTLYLEECGNAEGIPVLFVHGGPGSGINAEHRRFFNPERYRIILFDQRGAGRSTPHASLTDNTTDHLIADIEQIRLHLGVDQWMLFGGSWGSTLSLLYAQQHPERVSSMVLRGIFLSRQQDFDWLYRQGASAVFPDHWAAFKRQIPAAEQHNLLVAYYQRLTSANELERMAAAKAWSIWEGQCSTLQPKADVLEYYAEPHLALSMARIEAHYFMHQSFIQENQILTQANTLAGIRTIIVHGRYDMVCPMEQAYQLWEALPDAELHIVRDAGHSAFEPGIIDNLVRATDNLAQDLA